MKALSSDFFRCPPLAHDDITRFKALAEAKCIDLVKSTQIVNGPTQWTLEYDAKGLQIFTGSNPNLPPNLGVFCSVLELPATIHEIKAIFHSETTDQFRAYCRRVVKDFVDGQSLYVVVPAVPSQPHESTCIKWFVQRSPAPAIVKQRDWCYLDSCREFEHHGVRGWVLAYTSVNLPCCPDLYDALGFVRGHHHLSGYVISEIPDRPGMVRVTSLYQLDLRGQLPRWVVQLGLKIRCKGLLKLHDWLRVARLRQALPRLLPNEMLIPIHQQSKCFHCNHRFGSFYHGRNCRMCGQVVCKNCSRRWQVEDDNSIRLCTLCTKTTVHQPHSEAPTIALEYELHNRPILGECDDSSNTQRSDDEDFTDVLSTMSPSQSFDRNDLIVLPPRWTHATSPAFPRVERIYSNGSSRSSRHSKNDNTVNRDHRRPPIVLFDDSLPL
ncbi:unnamed protein product [Aphanomyces euteiches]